MSDPQFRVLGGPTVLIEIGGLRLLTDPTFDPAGEYPTGGRALVKTRPAPVRAAELGRLDAVLLSHDEHPDNLDNSGRELLAEVPLVLTTASGAGRLGGTARGLRPWQTHELTRPDGGVLVVTAVPAQHGPEGCEPVTGDVIGFVLTGQGVPTVYVSGDNASIEVVQRIAERFGPVDTAVLFAGAARTPLLDGALLTLDSELAARAASLLGARRVVPAHLDSWAHFTEGLTEFVGAFTAAGIADRLVLD
ncbi:MBL fold metallo-hydrolase [Kutzneria viridogrisea]|uniref:L-ascorbate metabolism protein UlaG (Beta-lactamase superfamily) n=1 Tax=Kutzneria viridogrisea TaxID=47990 RepID=A0ABR6B8H3_9PSEU|nr:L-ascorbate metabolism protein UlaG (beta-lactamase superfamily) [Kutzneria viridogrisea]